MICVCGISWSYSLTIIEKLKWAHGRQQRKLSISNFTGNDRLFFCIFTCKIQLFYFHMWNIFSQYALYSINHFLIALLIVL